MKSDWDLSFAMKIRHETSWWKLILEGRVAPINETFLNWTCVGKSLPNIVQLFKHACRSLDFKKNCVVFCRGAYADRKVDSWDETGAHGLHQIYQSNRKHEMRLLGRRAFHIWSKITRCSDLRFSFFKNCFFADFSKMFAGGFPQRVVNMEGTFQCIKVPVLVSGMRGIFQRI